MRDVRELAMWTVVMMVPNMIPNGRAFGKFIPYLYAANALYLLYCACFAYL